MTWTLNNKLKVELAVLYGGLRTQFSDPEAGAQTSGIPACPRVSPDRANAWLARPPTKRNAFCITNTWTSQLSKLHSLNPP